MELDYHETTHLLSPPVETFRIFGFNFAGCLLLALILLSGCGRPVVNVFNLPTPQEQKAEAVLDVETSITAFSGMLLVRSKSEKPITIRKTTINGKYVAEYVPTSMGGRGARFEPRQLEMGKGVVLWLDGAWPRPTTVDVETDRGTFSFKLTYQN